MSFASTRQSKTNIRGNTTSTSHTKPSRILLYTKKLTTTSNDAIYHLGKMVGSQSADGPTSHPNNTKFELTSIGIQPKLRISQANDPYEQEAEQVAEQVMRMSGSSAIAAQLSTTKKGTGGQQVNISLRPLSTINREINNEITAEINNIRSSPGSSLEADTKELMESRFGYDFSNIRIHTDGMAADSAKNVNALAYTIGSDIVFGSGQYQPDTRDGRKLLAHELTHVVQQSVFDKIQADQSKHIRGELSTGHLHIHKIHQPGSGVLHRDVIDDVREKLSYGIFDWAITDAEAMEALSALGTIPPADLANALKRLGSKYITRLLDNLPDAAKSGEIYGRIIEALGPGGVMPYASEQLSYGLLDWAITDAEITRVFNIFVNLSPAAQEQMLVDLNTAHRLGRLISNANVGHHGLYIRPWIATLPRGALTQRQRELLRTIVSETSDDAMETLKMATETRFDVTVGRTTIPGRPPVEWDPNLIRQAYLVLDVLPEAHIAKNKELLRFGQFRQAATSGGTLTEGVYSPATRELALNVEAEDVHGTLIHEVAHAVDREMGWSSVGTEPAKPSRGGWKTYGASYNDCAREIADDSAGAIKISLTAPQRSDVINEMANAMGNRSAIGLDGKIKSLPWFTPLPAATKNAVLADRALRALQIGLNEPWFRATGGGEYLADHVYQESYPTTWVRYRHEARSRMVSPYQFRDPGEWFAEAYKFYYLPDSRGRGAKLADRDPDTKRYFDTDVHTRAPSR